MKSIEKLSKYTSAEIPPISELSLDNQTEKKNLLLGDIAIKLSELEGVCDATTKMVAKLKKRVALLENELLTNQVPPKEQLKLEEEALNTHDIKEYFRLKKVPNYSKASTVAKMLYSYDTTKDAFTVDRGDIPVGKIYAHYNKHEKEIQYVIKSGERKEITTKEKPDLIGTSVKAVGRILFRRCDESLAHEFITGVYGIHTMYNDHNPVIKKCRDWFREDVKKKKNRASRAIRLKALMVSWNELIKTCKDPLEIPKGKITVTQ